MKYLAMFSIVLICLGWAAWQLTWLAWSLRGVLICAVILGLVWIVVRDKG